MVTVAEAGDKIRDLVPAVCAVTANFQQTDAVISLFERIASEEGWQPGNALREWQHRSIYFGLWNGERAEELVGGLQLVLPGPDGELPCHSVWPELAGATRLNAAHIAVMALRSDGRGRRSAAADPYNFWLACAELWRYCVSAGIRELWLEATPRTLKCYQRMGWSLTVRGELREHWGEPCYPCSASLRETVGTLSEKAVRSATYRRIMQWALDGGNRWNQ